MNYVINPLTKAEVASFFDSVSNDVIKYFMIKALFSQPEKLPGQDDLPVQIPKEHIEQWFTQALNVKPVGAGSYPIDIYNEVGRWGADIKMLNAKTDKSNNLTGADSGEASLGQNFKEAGIDLDNLFENKEYELIKDRWVKLYKDKFDSVSLKYPVDKFYYFFILRSGSSFYLVAASINLSKFDSVAVDTVRTTKSSVYVKGFIPENLGNTKIYKAKKRLELRLKPKEWVNLGYSIKFESNFKSIEADIRKICGNPDFLEKELEKLKNIEIKII